MSQNTISMAEATDIEKSIRFLFYGTDENNFNLTLPYAFQNKSTTVKQKLYTKITTKYPYNMTEEKCCDNNVLNEFYTQPREVRWNDSNTRMLIDLYKKRKPEVGTQNVRSIKHMWQIIAKELEGTLGISVAPSNCENRWKVLERNYRKYVNNNNATGKGKRYFEFYEEMKVLCGNKYSVFSELNSQTTHLPKSEQPNESTDTESDEINLAECLKFYVDKPSSSYKLGRKKSCPEKWPSVLEDIRKDNKKYQEKRLEIERSKLAEMKRKNDLLEERNNILKTLNLHILASDY